MLKPFSPSKTVSTFSTLIVLILPYDGVRIIALAALFESTSFSSVKHAMAPSPLSATASRLPPYAAKAVTAPAVNHEQKAQSGKCQGQPTPALLFAHQGANITHPQQLPRRRATCGNRHQTNKDSLSPISHTLQHLRYYHHEKRGHQQAPSPIHWLLP